MKIRKAVALRYDRDLPAPVITAKGRGRFAGRILEIAEQNGISVVRDDNLSDSLYTFNVGDLITEEYYEIVAEILAFILKV
ncbi:MAG: EscU/YscU/HrcU family type III secretion system export apparatus switch protein [Spirochaetales bacterium]|nr:EscU/YscU/HrcU family type III secretion system export apparatus switch protein [Spirochaetales bacterium]